MSKIVVKESESIEDALRRFKRNVSRSGTLQRLVKENITLSQAKAKTKRKGRKY